MNGCLMDCINVMLLEYGETNIYQREDGVLFSKKSCIKQM